MTQFYTYRGFSLRRAGTSIKVLITSFLLTVSVAVVVGVINYRLRTGLGVEGAVDWYRGNEATAGPAEPLLYEKTPLELLDATHAHLFGQAFLLFLLAHLFALTPVRSSVKLWAYVAAFASVAIDASVPWLIRFVSPAFAPLQPIGLALMIGTFLLFVLAPLREMWLVSSDVPEPGAPTSSKP
ncbi:MAG TPA: hypothetical protein VMN78_07135 [Longimicrobiales bacterium]|nr:hypothetical protein [Longimicrobiales bacterium]